MLFNYPVCKLIAMFNTAPFILTNEGYYFQKLSIVVDKSCTGFGFFCNIFLFVSLILIQYLSSIKNKLWIIPSSLSIAYFIAIIANFSRIQLSIFGQNFANQFLPQRPHLILHDYIGHFVFTSFLLLTCIILIFYLKSSSRSYEKSR